MKPTKRHHTTLPLLLTDEAHEGRLIHDSAVEVSANNHARSGLFESGDPASNDPESGNDPTLGHPERVFGKNEAFSQFLCVKVDRLVIIAHAKKSERRWKGLRQINAAKSIVHRNPVLWFPAIPECSEEFARHTVDEGHARPFPLSVVSTTNFFQLVRKFPIRKADFKAALGHEVHYVSDHTFFFLCS
jgi:hypothetical protein